MKRRLTMQPTNDELAELFKPVKRSKYGVRTDAAGKAARTVDGILFDSLKEARRYGELKLLQRAGMISGLALQVELPLAVSAVPSGKVTVLGHYVADFVYTDLAKPEGQRLITEDTKGHRTALFNWKVKHVEAQYGIKVLLT